MMTKPDAIYARYSSHAQDEGTSIEVQIEQCERAAGGPCRHYIDRAKTGRAMGGRDELIRLLADADAGKIGRVFVYKFDRLGRAAETHVIAQQLDDAHVPLVSATEGTNALARGIQLVVAEDYSRQLAQRTRDGLIKRFEQAAFTGGIAPYGYRVIDRGGRRVLAVESVEAEIVRGVVREFLNESVGLKIMAKRLRERGVASRRGKGWCFTSVRSVLLNPIYTGRVRYNVRRMHLDRRTGRRVPRFRAAAEHCERQDESLRIIDDESFARIQERIGPKAERRGLKRNRGIAAFTGLVFCPEGHKCYRAKSANGKGTYTYYVCSRHQRYD
ncbi:MAG: recombinase family protein, partial [Tepidisphaeraceae bacterium]